jgi:phosphatidylserine/phosphatidylglycerophosphate/cardiolipin synthase-like enzyme
MPGPLPARFPADTVALFPPRDNAALALELLVNAATSSIRVEMFTYCDAKLDAAIKAKAQPARPDFLYQGTFDAAQATNVSSMAKLLAGWNGDPRNVTGKSEHGQIIHRKIIIIDNHYLGSGSTNLTHDGEVLEDNELVIRRGNAIAQWYINTLDPNHQRLLPAAT